MSIPPLIAEALHTRRQFDIGLWRQFWQACTLRFGPCQLDAWEYFFFQVFLDRYTPDEKRCFVGWRREIRLDRLANAHAARNLANDKLACHALLDKHGIPLPTIAAVYRDVGPGIPDTTRLSDADGVATFLRDTDRYPLFVKPARGAHGKNTYVLHGLVNGDLQLSSNERLAMTNFIARLDPARKGGVLFQELLHTHRNIETVCSERLTSVRIIVILTPAGPEILSAVWRVPTGSNITDNFDCGRSGNIIAGIELATGRVQRIVRGIGWEIIPVDRHPDTGIAFANLHLPDWQAACALCLEAATLFPDLRLQHWDIALTDRGPVVLEINVEGGMRTHQIVQQRGIYDERLQQVEESLGDRLDLSTTSPTDRGMSDNAIASHSPRPNR
jgi:hypothetical protein